MLLVELLFAWMNKNFVGVCLVIVSFSKPNTFLYDHINTLTRFEGGLLEQCLKLSEGFAAALELADLMNTTREPW